MTRIPCTEKEIKEAQDTFDALKPENLQGKQEKENGRTEKSNSGA